MHRKQRRRKQFDPRRLDSLAYLDAAAVEHYAPIARRTFYQAIADGKLRAFRIGGNGKLVVSRKDLETFITRTPVENDLEKIADEAVAELEG